MDEQEAGLHQSALTNNETSVEKYTPNVAKFDPLVIRNFAAALFCKGFRVKWGTIVIVTRLGHGGRL